MTTVAKNEDLFEIDLTGAAIPDVDGQVSTYISTEAQNQKEYFTDNRKVFFINGMGNTGEDHARSALALSLVQMCPVIGVFNKSGGFASDLWQCLMDKNQFNGPFSRTAKKRTIAGSESRKLVRERMIVAALSRNVPQISLFRVLRKNLHSEIFAHSQGNLILSNVLQAIAAVDGPASVTNRIVHTFGSPTVRWPDGLIAGKNLLEHGFTFDPVNWLSGLDRTFSISKVGMPSSSRNPITHGFLEYMTVDAEFVVNRFRVGGLKATFSMDEEGLAQCLIAMDTNLSRVLRIFQHINVHHNSDADDVASEYVRHVRAMPQLTKVLAASPPLVDLLITILDEGWTDSEDQDAIDWLKKLRPQKQSNPMPQPTPQPGPTPTPSTAPKPPWKSKP